MNKDLKKRIKKVLITLKPQGTVTTALKYK
jgi:hypothetical protein